jgi:predicted phosphodiesterase
MPTPKLSPDLHRKIHELVGKGLGPGEVARRLGISHGSVINYQRLPLPPAAPSECPPAALQKARPVLQLDKPGVWGVLSDVHVPHHDVKALDAAVNFLRKRNPYGILINGDFLDFHELSNHDKDPGAPRYVEELETGRSVLAWLRNRFPKARIIYRFGNHEERLDRYILQRAPALFDLPYADVRLQLQLDDLGIELVRDKRLIRLGKLNTLHGHEYRGGGGINPARWLHYRAHAATLCGHFHRPSFHPWRTVDGTSSGCWSVGCLCHLTPDFSVNNEWNHGFAVVAVAPGGVFEVENKLIIDGRVC